MFMPPLRRRVLLPFRAPFVWRPRDAGGRCSGARDTMRPGSARLTRRAPTHSDATEWLALPADAAYRRLAVADDLEHRRARRSDLASRFQIDQVDLDEVPADPCGQRERERLQACWSDASVAWNDLLAVR